MIKRHNGTVEWVNVGGIPLGIGLGAKAGSHEICFDVYAGDMIILISDGVVEAQDSDAKLFGFEHVDAAITADPQISATAMLMHLCVKIESFIRKAILHDDRTIVVVRA